jgi:N-(5'phosphoribosyl)anthranilate (PRA) isomerase
MRAKICGICSLDEYVAISVTSDESIAIAKEFEDSADAVILDSMNKETGARGGTGKTHDWSISQRIVESTSSPVILAGGLNPDNVADAINAVRPYAVDVNSGVSNPDGTKHSLSELVLLSCLRDKIIWHWVGELSAVDIDGSDFYQKYASLAHHGGCR